MHIIDNNQFERIPGAECNWVFSYLRHSEGFSQKAGYSFGRGKVFGFNSLKIWFCLINPYPIGNEFRK